MKININKYRFILEQSRSYNYELEMIQTVQMPSTGMRNVEKIIQLFSHSSYENYKPIIRQESCSFRSQLGKFIRKSAEFERFIVLCFYSAR